MISNMARYVKEFEENQFWQSVMKPAMEASIREAMAAMVYSESIRDLRALQTGIKMTKSWLDFPRSKQEEDEAEAEFEKSRQEAEEAGAEKPA